MVYQRDGLPIVPDGRASRCELESALYIHIIFIHILQIAQDEVALLAVEPHNVRHPAVGDIEALPAGDGVHAHNGVGAVDGAGAARRRVVPIEVLLLGDEDGPLTVEEAPKVGRELRVRGVPARPQQVPAHLGHRVLVQVRVAWWVPLVDHVTAGNDMSC